MPAYYLLLLEEDSEVLALSKNWRFELEAGRWADEGQVALRKNDDITKFKCGLM
jgi:hypothetical protein